jgi:hypothetical protein
MKIVTELLKSWKWRDEKVEEFFNECKDLPDLLNSSVLIVRTYIQSTSQPDHSLERAMLVNFWRTVYDYQEDALFLILCERFDAAFAMMRLASELTRDLARMGEDPVNFKMWMNKESEKDKKHYKETFRFNMSDELEEFVFSQYKTFSRWGVHGHLTGDIARKPEGVTPCETYVKLEITEDSILQNIGIWGLSFLSVHQMCARVFESEIRRSQFPISLADFSVEAGNLFKVLLQRGKNKN